jgi:hypothetical protein
MQSREEYRSRQRWSMHVHEPAEHGIRRDKLGGGETTGVVVGT